MKAARSAWVGGTEPPRPPQHPVGPSPGSVLPPALLVLALARGAGQGARSSPWVPSSSPASVIKSRERSDRDIHLSFPVACWAGKSNRRAHACREGVNSASSAGRLRELGFAAPSLCALNSADVMPSDQLSTAPGHLVRAPCPPLLAPLPSQSGRLVALPLHPSSSRNASTPGFCLLSMGTFLQRLTSPFSSSSKPSAPVCRAAGRENLFSDPFSLRG